MWNRFLGVKWETHSLHLTGGIKKAGGCVCMWSQLLCRKTLKGFYPFERIVTFNKDVVFVCVCVCECTVSILSSSGLEPPD